MYRRASVASAAHPFLGYGVKMDMQTLFKNLFKLMTRREFFSFSIIGVILGLLGKKGKAEEKPKEAMFWRRID